MNTVVEQLKEGHEERLRASGRVSVPRGDDLKGNDGPRRFEGLAYSGAAVDRPFGKMVVDVKGIAHGERMGMLLEHDDDRPVAVADRFEPRAEGLKLAGYFLDDKASAGESTKLVAKADQGWPLKMSIGIRFISHRLIEEGDEVAVNGRTFEGPIVVVDRCHLFETSFIHVNPADLDTGASVLRGAKATRLKAASLKKRLRQAKRNARTAWLNHAAVVLAPVFHEVGLYPRVKSITLEKLSDEAAALTRLHPEGRHEIVVDPRLHRDVPDVGSAYTSQAVYLLLHELLHCALDRGDSHESAEWKRSAPLVGLSQGGYDLNDLGIKITCRVLDACGEWPK